MGKRGTQNDATKEWFAFISYSSKDIDWALWVQHELEHYNLPVAVIKKYKSRVIPKELRPVFRDDDELSAGDLLPQIKKALSKSKNLIVICSPNAKASYWVNLEIEYFISSNGNASSIFPLIVEGNSPDACFPTALDKSIAAGNVNKSGKDAALVKVIAGMLGIGFRDLWNRYEKEKVAREKEEREKRDRLLTSQSRFVSYLAEDLVKQGDSYTAVRLALEILPGSSSIPDRPYSPEAEKLLRNAVKRNNGILKGHTECVRSAVFSSDDSRVFSISDDRTIKSWDVQTGYCEQTLTEHTDEITCICLNKRRKLFATASKDSKVIIWDENTLTPTAIIPHPSGVYHVDFDVEGNRFLSVSEDYVIRIWELNNTREPMMVLNETGEMGVVSATFCSNSNHLVVALMSEVRILDLSKGRCQCIKTFKFDDLGPVWCVNYNVHRNIIIIVNRKQVLLLDASKDYMPTCPPMEHDGGGRWACISQDETELAITSDYDVSLWMLDKKTGKYAINNQLKGHSRTTLYVSFNNTGSQLLSTSSDETVRLWDISKKKQITDYSVSPVTSVALIPNSDRAVAIDEESIIIFSTETGEILKKKQSLISLLNTGAGSHFVFSDSTGEIVYVSNGDCILPLKAEDLTPVRSPFRIEAENYSHYLDGNLFHAVSPKGERALTAHKDGTMLLWDMLTGKVIKAFHSDKKRSNKGAFSPDGEALATIAYDRGIELWNSDSGEQIMVLEQPHNYLGTSLSFSFDGKLIISSSSSRRVHIWDVKTGKLIRNDTFHHEFASDVQYVEFSKDSKYFATVSDNDSVHIFETSSGKEVDSYSAKSIGIQGRVFKVKFSDDSKKILHITNNSVIAVSVLSLADLINQQEKRFGKQTLSELEKHKYYIE